MIIKKCLNSFRTIFFSVNHCLKFNFNVQIRRFLKFNGLTWGFYGLGEVTMFMSFMIYTCLIKVYIVF